MIISEIKSKYHAISKMINIYEMGASQYCFVGNQNTFIFKLCIKISSAEIFQFIN